MCHKSMKSYIGLQKRIFGAEPNNSLPLSIEALVCLKIPWEAKKPNKGLKNK